MPQFLFIRRWRNLKLDISTCVYSITYARVRIVYDKLYRVEIGLYENNQIPEQNLVPQHFVIIEIMKFIVCLSSF